jgi:hypothetical protein
LPSWEVYHKESGPVSFELKAASIIIVACGGFLSNDSYMNHSIYVLCNR